MGKFRKDKPSTVDRKSTKITLLKSKQSANIPEIKMQKILPAINSSATKTTSVKPTKKMIQSLTKTTTAVASKKLSSNIVTRKLKKQQRIQQKRVNLIETVKQKQKLAKNMKHKLKTNKQKCVKKNNIPKMMEFKALQNILSELDDCIKLVPKSAISKKKVNLKQDSIMKLPIIETTTTTTATELNTKIKSKESLTVSKSVTVRKNRQKKKKEFMDRCKYLEKLMGDKMFRKNPREVIKQHIENKFFESKFSTNE